MSKYVPKIDKVDNNNQKYLSIKDANDRFNKAYKYEFYYECLWIAYALLEDRTDAFFYHIGFLDRNRHGVDKKTKETVIRLLNIDKANPRYNFSKLFYKLDYMNELFNWVQNEDDVLNNYEKELRRVLTKYINNDEFLNTISYLNSEWRDIRNELTHGLCNKKVDAVSIRLKELAYNGHNCFKVMNKVVRNIKNNHIRKKFKMQ